MKRRSLVLLDASVPLLVGAVIVAAALIHPPGAPQSVSLLVELAAAASLVARRRAPFATLAVSGALVLVALHIDPRVAPVAVLAPAVALFSLALTRGRAQQLVAAAVAVGIVVTADLLFAGSGSVLQTLAHVALVSVPLLAAEALRLRRSQLALLTERLALIERSHEQETQRRVEQERLRIARDPHDIVAHGLVTINVQSSTAAELIDHDPAFARTALHTIEDASRDALTELRAVLGVLRETGSPRAPTAPTPSIENIPELVRQARESGLGVRLDVAGRRAGPLLEGVSLAAYRIVQESLTNVHKHAAGAAVDVRLGFGPDDLTVEVRSVGGGRSTAVPGYGVGITGMIERAESLGGHLEAAGQPGGFRVVAVLPYAGAPR